jgi:transposase
MLTPRPAQQIFLAVEPVDTRGGFDRLAGRVLHAGLDLYAGHLFVFVSRRREHLKNLTWDGSGLLILYKRLSKGRFTLPDVDRAARTVTHHDRPRHPRHRDEIGEEGDRVGGEGRARGHWRGFGRGAGTG